MCATPLLRSPIHHEKAAEGPKRRKEAARLEEVSQRRKIKPGPFYPKITTERNLDNVKL